MKKNIGTTDRILRIVIGLGIIAYGVVNHSWLGAIGVIPLLTAFVAFCPAYLPFGLSTVGKSCCGCDGGKCDK